MLHATTQSTDIFICVSGFISLLFAGFQFRKVAQISLNDSPSGTQAPLVAALGIDSARLLFIYEAIREGADSFLLAEYTICLYFLAAFGVVVFCLVSYTNGEFHPSMGGLTAVAFVAGGLTSMLCGLIGMKVAVFSNARTTIMAAGAGNPWTNSFNVAFRAGSVMGFALCGLGMLVLYALAHLFALYYSDWDVPKSGSASKLFECLAGYGLGGSSIALFGRVGGGIYTKAADVGADLAGKVVQGIPEDDPRNPATIADNVGDNVGDVAGMGSDLFGSFAEATCAALVVASNSESLLSAGGWAGLMFPVTISAAGILVCLVCSFVATTIAPVRKEKDIETVLKTQLGITTVILTVVVYFLAVMFLPDTFELTRVSGAGSISFTPIKAWGCVCAGLWSGCLIGFITEYFTSHSYTPVREVAQACETGAATNIIYGLALGYKSAILPVTLISVVVYLSFHLGDMYGVALAALGMLSNLATCLSIDVYGPICDNAGGIAEMAELPDHVRDITDALDAAGNTTAAIGKGFAIGSACLVGLALFGAFVTRAGLTTDEISLLSPLIFASLIFGAMIPYWFFAMTMKSVGKAANEMVKEVARQFREIPGLLEGAPGHAPADHARCIAISTDASLREMILPGVLVMATPLLFGTLLGTDAVAGLLAGSIASAVQMAISSSNTGGAWDNAKKYVEKGQVVIDGVPQRKGSELHKAAVVGDTVGDPLKDTSGPALNIVMKLMAILSLVFADFFKSINNGHGLLRIPHN
eukprot:CAMPEP_0197583860 /NCGR_PEP_ID=MMETSP1326-20131121/6638_1 /TAXON_ID=1155430 /ORGANISM="Genus nov. species nov., Strain RCC2288" /LENGTH=756 /DNA_ID=CAMNT_0043148139 /DNA_START=153 /DNA_END=2423 /DNA_ORIENTATION=-